jgi:histidine phosphotransferase ChpT
MKIKPTNLAELVCTRISHDLIGNIGALSNILEMLPEMDGKLEPEDSKLMETAVQTLSARQQFFRLAFGCDTSAIEASKLHKICQDYLHTVGNRSFPLNFECNNMSPQIAKVLCLCLMIGAEVCLRGGHIKVDVSHQIRVEVCSDSALAVAKVKIYEQILGGKEPAENAAQFVQLIYLRALLDSEVPIKMSSTQNTMTLIIG